MSNSLWAVLAITTATAAAGAEPEAQLSPLVSLPPVIGVVLRTDRVSIAIAEPWILQFGGRSRPDGWHRLQFVVEPAVMVQAALEGKALRFDHPFEVTWGMRRMWMPLPRAGLAAGLLMTHNEKAPASPSLVTELLVSWGGKPEKYSYSVAARALLRDAIPPEFRIQLALNLW